MSSRRFRVALGFGSLAFSLALVEILARLLLGFSAGATALTPEDLQRRFLQPHPSIGTIHRTDVDVLYPFPERPDGVVRFRTNNLGLRRDSDTAFVPPDGVRRILVLGDSHVDGVVNNTENLCALLEAELESRSGDSWEVLNAAVGGYSPYQGYLWHLTYGTGLAPELVLWFFYSGNDFAEMVSSGRPTLSGPKFELETPEPSLAGRLHFWFADHSAVYAFLRARFAAPGRGGRTIHRAFAECPGCTGQYLAQVHWFHGQGLDSWKQAGNDFRTVTSRFSQAVENDGGELLLVQLPSPHAVDPDFDSERLAAALEVVQIDPDWEQLESRIRETVSRIASEEGVRQFDLLPVFVQHQVRSSEPLYYRSDWHLNPLGHAEAASAVAEWLLADVIDRD